MKSATLFAVLLSLGTIRSAAAEPLGSGTGDSLSRHDFLYAGESKNRRAFLIKKGQVEWTYDDPAGRGEVSDAVLLSNGRLLLAHQYAVKLIAPDKTVLWNLEAPKGAEIHTAVPIGAEHVLYVQNGDPAWVRVVHVPDGEVKKEFQVPVGNPKGTHGHFRHARITPRGTVLIAHMDMNKVCEYNAEGREVWSFPADGPWSATPLANGNALIVDRQGVREVTRRGDAVASFSKAELQNWGVTSLQLASRLSNGNTIINSWFNEWSGTVDKTKPPVQAIEVTQDKQVVWTLRSWENPDLGPATTIQILDNPEKPEAVSFGGFK